MKKKLHNSILPAAVFLLILSFNGAFAQPSNDDCTGAILITTSSYSDMGGTYTDVNTSGATASSPNPSCITSSDNNDDVWYKFVAQTQTELLRVHSDNGSLAFCYALYAGCGGTEIVCNNAMGTNYANEALGGLTPGNTYFLRFWSQFNFTSLSFSFSVQDINPITPSNEQITATALTINDGGSKCISPQFFTTASATRSSPDPSCNADNDDDVWFKFITPADGVVNIYPEEGAQISSGGFLTLGMQIIDATNGLTAACIPTIGVGSTSAFSGAGNREYFLRIWSKGTSDRGVFALCLQDGFSVLPPNDTCAAAENLTVGSGTCTSSKIGSLYNSNATPGLSRPLCTSTFPLLNDVWYKVTIPASGNVVVQTSATTSYVNDLILQAYSGSCAALTEIACDDNGNADPWPSSNHGRISLTGRSPGETIFVRVVPKTGNNLGQFSICAFDETATGLPGISINNVNKNEGDAGTKKYSFTISLSAASTQKVKVKYKTLDQTATAPEDYTAVSSTQVTFNPGEVAKIVKITVNGDTSVESDEKFKVKLLNPVNAVIADAIGVGTIRDDDGSPFAFSNEATNATATRTAITVYPNPAKDILNINLLQSSGNYNITISDIAGRTLKQFNAIGKQKKISVPVGELQSGIYLVTIHSNEGSQSIKFVKQ
ncbi:MAG TPA: T9SS type A sorting domain-containing protein [Parafilimonas sp.]|nr:T9SS type A sorting domain-containing protein [Parafilimonas sp.]